MDLILNNIKGLGIQLLMTIFSIVEIYIGVVISPMYTSQVVAIFTIICLYVGYILVYLKLSCWLKVENSKRNDYLVGILSFFVGMGMWIATIYYSGCSIAHIPEEVSAAWIPYNAYIFPSWIFVYGDKNPLINLLGSLSPSVLLTVGLKIKRHRCKLI